VGFVGPAFPGLLAASLPTSRQAGAGIGWAFAVGVCRAVASATGFEHVFFSNDIARRSTVRITW